MFVHEMCRDRDTPRHACHMRMLEWGGECLQTRTRDMKWPGPPSKPARPGILVLHHPFIIMSDTHGDRDSSEQPKSAESAFGALRTRKNVVHV